MSTKIPNAVLAALAQKVRENPEKLMNLTFPNASTSLTAIKTQDLRFDVHKNTKNSKMATGIIQANSGAKNKAVKSFTQGSTGAHKGTHQVIGEKISFGLGNNFNVEEVASAIERGGVAGEVVESAVSGSTAGNPPQSEWTWDDQSKRYYRQKSDGNTEWGPVSDTTLETEWAWSPEYKKYWRIKSDGTTEWS